MDKNSNDQNEKPSTTLPGVQHRIELGVGFRSFSSVLSEQALTGDRV